MHWQVLVLVTGPLAQLQCSLIYFRRLVLVGTEKDEVNGTGNSGGLIAKLYHSMSGNWPLSQR